MSSSAVLPSDLLSVYEEARTPHKVGVVLRGEGGAAVDCPCVYRFGGAWFMMYVCMNRVGYETHLARSDDLLNWQPLGKVLSFREHEEHAWDRWQADGGMALIDPTWGGSMAPGTHDGKYWLSYIGGALQGYEPDPLSIGMAWSTTPDRPVEWNRLAQNPVLSPFQPDVREFEKKTLYKSQVIDDPARTLGRRFVMFYNGKQDGPRGWERIGMAVSDDLRTWHRHGAGPVIDNVTGISGDPQIVRIGDLWVMFYFGHVWKPKAFDTFAVSRDLVTWTQWDGPHLVEPSEPFDSTFAHKPWLLKHDGVVYHFYCAVAGKERTIAVATSKKL
jgi:predicted GH43/DUF377 family glycosyl hydrolase